MVTTLRKLHGPVPQSEPLDERQVKNEAGGYVYQIGDFQRLHRWLILGSEGGTYYVNERKHTQENVKALRQCLKEDWRATLKMVEDISVSGRAPKNDWAIYALAVAASCEIQECRELALDLVPKVCRTGTHLFMFAEFCNEMRGWGRGLRTAIGEWYTNKTPDQLAYQVVKYQQRGGWSHADLLRLSHPRPFGVNGDKNALFKYIVDGHEEGRRWEYPDLVNVAEDIKRMAAANDVTTAAQVIREFKLPREAVPTELLKSPDIWEALLGNGDMPMTAMIRNLATMTRVGLLAPLSAGTKTVCEMLTDSVKLKKARIHPMQILIAGQTYGQGHGERGQHTWTPVQQVMDALDGAFHKSFENVEPIRKPVIIGLDISSSMFGNPIGGSPGMTAAMGAAAMALVTAAVEPEVHIMAYTTKPVIVNGITGRSRLGDVYGYVEQLSRQMGGTDCAQPFLWANGNKVKADFVVSYTDNQTWAGRTHPQAAFDLYRREINPDCRAAVVAMTATNYSMFSEDDAGAMNVVGFDSATPNILSAFARGEV